MKKYGKQFTSLWVLVCFALLTACTSLPSDDLSQQQFSPAERLDFNRQVFDKAWELVDERFFDENFNGKDWTMLGAQYRPQALAVDNTDDLYSVMNDMMSELEVSHVGVSRYSRLKGVPERVVLGVNILYLEGSFLIVSVMPSSAAELAGVQKGWLITARNGIALTTENFSQFKGEAGVPENFTFVDADDQVHELRFSPQLADLNPGAKDKDPIEMRELADGYLYLKIDNFIHSQVMKSMRLKLGEHLDAPGVIVDLRGNPGGRLDRLAIVIGHFFDEEVDIGTYVTRKEKAKERESWRWRSVGYSGPVVVLTDGGTGSAAEIFTHVFQQHERATIVGRKTAGAVLAMREYRLPDNGRVSIPERDYVGINGERIEGVGIQPDVEVPVPTLAELRARKDKDIEAALAILSGNKG